MKKMRLKHFLFLFIILTYACEDDPVLGPQVDDCAPGDSYCVISLPGDKQDSKSDNPETF